MTAQDTPAESSWKERAIKAHEDRKAAAIAAAEERRFAAKMRAASEFISRLEQLRIVAHPELISENGSLVLDGVTFLHDKDGLHCKVKCTACERSIKSYNILDLSDLGGVLSGEGSLPYHECGQFEEDANYRHRPTPDSLPLDNLRAVAAAEAARVNEAGACDCTVDCDGQSHTINYCAAHKAEVLS